MDRVKICVFSLSRNAFLFENGVLQSLLNAIRLNGKIYHMQMDWQDPKMVLAALNSIFLTIATIPVSRAM